MQKRRTLSKQELQKRKAAAHEAWLRKNGMQPRGMVLYLTEKEIENFTAAYKKRLPDSL